MAPSRSLHPPRDPPPGDRDANVAVTENTPLLGTSNFAALDPDIADVPAGIERSPGAGDDGDNDGVRARPHPSSRVEKGTRDMGAALDPTPQCGCSDDIGKYGDGISSGKWEVINELLGEAVPGPDELSSPGSPM